MTILATPLNTISLRARPYPAHLLPEGGTGLVLFAAAFEGHNDAIHMARRDMTATCVDRDRTRLRRMQRLYPAAWEFVHADAWEYAAAAAADRRVWDAVSVDTFTDDVPRSLASLDLWCGVARAVVTATITDGHPYTAPECWGSTRFPRTAGVDWLVLTRP